MESRSKLLANSQGPTAIRMSTVQKLEEGGLKESFIRIKALSKKNIAILIRNAM